MAVQKIRIGDKEVMPFTIPSGIITTETSTIQKFANEIPELGIITTKSIGPKERAGNREPIFAQYMPYGFVNAVGLTNPGPEEAARRLSLVSMPRDKFLLASIFGGNAEEFVYVARTLEDCVDGFELNLSCPHAKGYGMQLGQDKDMVFAITRSVVGNTKKPVFAKLTPNAGNIGDIANAAVAAGAHGITAINTVGPGYHEVDGHPVLTNKVGGLSGRAIKPVGLKCVREIRQTVGERVPIIGMGGIANASDVAAYGNVGANVFGIGSSLVGMDDLVVKEYFTRLIHDLNSGTNDAEKLLRDGNMIYRKVKIEENISLASDFKMITADRSIKCEPGQFVFAWIPGTGEKPFSVMNNDPLTFGVLEVGEFTRRFGSLNKGDEFYIRGPYGISPKIPSDGDLILVGGGCGIPGVTMFAKYAHENKRAVRSFIGAKDRSHLAYIAGFAKAGELRVATEDGSLGMKGNVLNLLKEGNVKPGSYFVNCGPKRMVEAVLPFELSLTSPERIYSSVDYTTRCGVGICGSCADKKGRRTCVEGPFVNP